MRRQKQLVVAPRSPDPYRLGPERDRTEPPAMQVVQAQASSQLSPLNNVLPASASSEPSAQGAAQGLSRPGPHTLELFEAARRKELQQAEWDLMLRRGVALRCVALCSLTIECVLFLSNVFSSYR